MNGKTHVISTVPFWSIFQLAKCKRLPECRSSHFQLCNQTHLQYHHHHHHHHHLLESRTGPLSMKFAKARTRKRTEWMDGYPSGKKKGTWWKPQDSMDWYGLVACQKTLHECLEKLHFNLNQLLNISGAFCVKYTISYPISYPPEHSISTWI